MQFSAAVWACWKAPLSICPYEGLVCIARALAGPLNRLLRHGVSGLGGIRGVRGGAMHRQRQAPARGRRIALSWPCIFISFSALEQGDPRGVPCPQRYHFGVQGYASTPFYPSPLVTRGQIFKKAVKSTAYLFPASFISYRFDIILI